jgi:hypothetical protein
MGTVGWVILGCGYWVACALVAANVSWAKGRPSIEGGLYGLVLGPMGVVVAALMPTPGDGAGASGR